VGVQIRLAPLPKTRRDRPERYGSWKSVYDRLRRWSADGTIDRILKRLRYKLDEDGFMD
jgi:transposase